MKLDSKFFNIIESLEDVQDYTLSSDLLVRATITDVFWAGGRAGYSVYDQKLTSMCGAFTMSGIEQKFYFDKTEILKEFSKAFPYGNRLDNGEYLGEGVYPRDIIKDCRTDGICFMEQFPLLGTVEECVEGFKNLSQEVRDEAKKHRIGNFYRMDMKNKQQVIDTLVTFDRPISMSMLIYPSIQNAYGDGIVGDIQSGEQMVGGHMVLCAGVKNINGRLYWIIVNSWGKDFGDEGIFYIPVDSEWVFEAWMVFPYEEKEIVFTIGQEQYTVNGKVVAMDTCPVVVNERNYLPLRYVMESIDAFKVEWVSEQKKVKIYINNDILTFPIGAEGFDSDLQMRRIPFETDKSRAGLTKTFIDENGRTMIPTRAIFEHLGLNVSWDGTKKQVIVRNY